MPQNTTIAVPKWTWTQLTNADATDITFVNAGGAVMLVKGTVGATPPTSTDGAIPYDPGAGEVARSLVDMFPGVAGVTRLYAYGKDDTTSAMVSNA